jgi:GNAT superfamily N-acetyltransferase
LIENLRIEPLRREHAVEHFTCGEAALDDFLSKFALPSQQANASRTYVAVSNATIVGFYTLVASEIAYMNAPPRLSKGQARHPIPLMLLARLAVHRGYQGQRLGSGLLVDAMKRAPEASQILGIRALAVHAKNEAAEKFYQHFGFVPSPADPRHLYLLLKDIQRMLST